MRVVFVSLCLCILTLAGCAQMPPTTSNSIPASTDPDRLSYQAAAMNFITVVDRMQPVIERECRDRTRHVVRNCEFRIMVDDRSDQEPNAFQTLDRRGRPIVAFNLALIAAAHNQDELAFVMAHEAAHHIEGHLQSKEHDAIAGASMLSSIVAASGGSASAVRHAQNMGAEVGALTFAKDYELQADRLGTVITWDAGYDPLKGAQFFARIPDPGEVFLGSHPANALRIDMVKKTVAELKHGTI
ncbi:M48 family metalloprotease [Rhodobacteraceae bacterium]|nr:M48 family metalloprotease [Paracoccaceae bacterium]